jgi:hypothetical protein
MKRGFSSVEGRVLERYISPSLFQSISVALEMTSGSIKAGERLVEKCLSDMAKFSNSPAEWTSGWLEMIRFTSVVPLRGKPIIKMGSFDVLPPLAGTGAANERVIAQKIASSCWMK